MPSHSLLGTSTNLLLQAQGHVGKGLHPPAGMQWRLGPTTTVLGPAPSSVHGAACSGLFKLPFTVAHIERLGLDTSPQQLTAEICQTFIGRVQVSH